MHPGEKRPRDDSDYLQCCICQNPSVAPIALCKEPHVACYGCVHEMINASISESKGTPTFQFTYDCPLCRTMWLMLYDIRVPIPIPPRYGRLEIQRVYDEKVQWTCPFCAKDLGRPTWAAQCHILDCVEQRRTCPFEHGHSYKWKTQSLRDHLEKDDAVHKCNFCTGYHTIGSPAHAFCTDVQSYIQECKSTTELLLTEHDPVKVMRHLYDLGRKVGVWLKRHKKHIVAVSDAHAAAHPP